MAKCRLTTIDNPFDPFTDYKRWHNYDLIHGHYSSERLAKIERTSDSLTEEENDAEIERAIDEIIKYDILKKYKKVYKKTE